MQFELKIRVSAENIHVLSNALAASCHDCINNNMPCTIGYFGTFNCPFNLKKCTEINPEDWEAILECVDDKES